MIRELYYQVLVYRSLITPFLVASSTVLPFWLALRLYRSRVSARPASLSREVLLAVFVAYLACLAAATLAPNHNERLRSQDTTGIELRPSIATLTCTSAATPSGSRARHFCMYNTKGNLLLFVPFGFLIPLIWRRLSVLRGVIAAAAVSGSIEVLQLVSRSWESYRAVDVNDVVLNVAGACIGLSIAYLVRSLAGLRGGSAPASLSA